MKYPNANYNIMATIDKTPLWLELKKEYIDDNFEKLQAYLQEKSRAQVKDSFYDTTIELLRERVKVLLDEMAATPIYVEKQNGKSTTFYVNLLATYLLVDDEPSLTTTAYVAFMNGLRELHPRMSGRTLKTAVERLKHARVASLGFTWSDLSKIGTELFAFNACVLARFEAPLKKPVIFAKYGTSMLTENGLLLTCETRETAKALLKSGANSFDTGIGVSIRTASSAKMKQSQENDLVAMEKYLKDFIQQLRKAQNRDVVTSLKSYDNDDEVVIRITNIDAQGTVFVETVDPEYKQLVGTIKWKHPSLMYYYTKSLYEYFRVGDFFTATLTNADEATFSLDEQLVKFFVEDTKEVEEEGGSVFLCKLIDEKQKRFGWLSERGVAFYSDKSEEYKKGDFAMLEVKRYGKGTYYGVIETDILEESNESFDERTVRHDCIRAFAEYTPEPVYETKEEDNDEMHANVLSLLLRQMYEHQKTLLKPSDRFRFLANAYVMAEMVGEELSASYLKFARTYLRALIQFVNHEDIKAIELEPDESFKDAKPTLIRLSIIQLLKEYGKTENSELLARTIADFEDEIPILARLARLIQTANSMQGTLSDAAINVIRREIIKTLSLETENDADLESESGAYLGVESGTMEFKTSMVFHADKENHMQPDEPRQNHNVLKGVCAFLNSTSGGTLYLGVNDQGYVAGIEEDMKHLRLQTIDSYLRYVQDTAKKYLGIDALTYIRIEPQYDNRVVAIHVEPHPYRLVELSGVAYLRVNAESREMPEKVREEIIARKVFKDRNRAAAISLLQHACTVKKRVILHNYASSNGGTVSDRCVEAYDVRPKDHLVTCYDCDKQAVRVFNINRIGYVEILNDKPWTNAAHHKPVKVDVFHMTGESTIHVFLQLDLMAKNLLVEEYPLAEKDIQPHKGDPNIWYFNTEVCSMEGVGRFYIGMANHITILDGPELKQYAAEFAKKYLE